MSSSCFWTSAEDLENVGLRIVELDFSSFLFLSWHSKIVGLVRNGAILRWDIFKVGLFTVRLLQQKFLHQSFYSWSFFTVKLVTVGDLT